MSGLEIAGYVLGIAGGLAVVISVLLYARTSGNITALQQTAETYKGLYESEREKSEAYRSENEGLRARMDGLDFRIKTLETERMARKETDDEWVGRLLTTVADLQVCEIPDCPRRAFPDRRTTVMP